MLTSSPAGTTYVQGTDYSVDARTGLITQIAGGALTATEAVLVTYTYYSGTPYVAGTDYAIDPINGVATALAGG
ncbi:MAG: hypothetical protein ACP5QO_03025, partial [Clostridia bacterium]